MKFTLTGLVGNDTAFATVAATGFVLLHILAVQTSTIPLHTLAGDEVVAVFPAIAEIFIIVGLCWRLGSLAGMAVIFTSYALGMALAAPGAVIPTTAGKLAVVAVVAPLLPRWRHWHPMALLFGLCGVAMVTDTVVFGLFYGHVEVIPASLFIKAQYMIAAGVIFGARRPRKRDQPGGHDQAGPGRDIRDAGPDRLEPVPADRRADEGDGVRAADRLLR